MSSETVLVVDDDDNSCQTLGSILELHGYAVHTAQTGAAAEALVRAHPIDAALLDLRLPDRSGIDVLRLIKTISPDTEVLMVSGYATLTSAIEAIRYGAVGYVLKPIQVEEVLESLKQAMERQRAARALRKADAENRERVQELEVLLESVRQASSRMELAEVLQVLAEQMVRKLQVTLCHIAVLEEDQAYLRIRAIYPVRPVSWGFQLDSRIPLSQAPSYERAVRQREVILLRDTAEHPLANDLALAMAGEIRSALLAPIAVHDQIVGVVTAFEARQWDRSPFSPEKVNLCAAMASGAAVAIEKALLFEDRERAHLATLVALDSALDVRERETRAHSLRVQQYSLALARTLGIPEADLKALAAGALLHDIGKIGVSDTILLKAGPLSEEEWEAMRRHPQIGAEILRGLTHLGEARDIVIAHQERWDGSGYPHGLKAEAIPLGARIFALADALDAITSDRPYRPKKSFEQAREEIVQGAGTQFDPKVVEAFLATPLAEWARIQRETSTGPENKLAAESGLPEGWSEAHPGR